MTASETGKLALLWPRDAPKWNAKTPQDDRLHRVFEAMAALGIEAEPAIYADDVADQVRQQLLHCDGVLVWVDPLFAGQNRIGTDIDLAKQVERLLSARFVAEIGASDPSRRL